MSVIKRSGVIINWFSEEDEKPVKNREKLNWTGLFHIRSAAQHPADQLLGILVVHRYYTY